MAKKTTPAAGFNFVRWDIEALTGYKPQTTFWEDFCIADAYGAEAVIDTYRRAFKAWHDNTAYVTELVLVLNHKIWQHYKTNRPLAAIYDKLWKECDAWCLDNFKGEDADYYYRITD